MKNPDKFWLSILFEGYALLDLIMLDLVDLWLTVNCQLGFQICSADAVADMEEDLKVLMKADPDRQASLQTEVIPDPMEGEQTWPTEEELSEAHGWYWQTSNSSGLELWVLSNCSQ